MSQQPDLALKHVPYQCLLAGGIYLAVTYGEDHRPCFHQVIKGTDAHIGDMKDHSFYMLHDPRFRKDREEMDNGNEGA